MITFETQSFYNTARAVAYIVVATQPNLVSLVQLRFTTDNQVGGLTASQGIYTFAIPTEAQRAEHRTVGVILIIALAYLLVLELCELVGIEIVNGRPKWQSIRHLAAYRVLASMKQYILSMQVCARPP